MDENTTMLIERINILENKNQELLEEIDTLKYKNKEIYEKMKDAVETLQELTGDLYYNY